MASSRLKSDRLLALQGGGSHGAFTWGVLDALLEDGRVTQDIVDGMRREISDVQNDPNAVFFYSFVQTRATVY